MCKKLFLLTRKENINKTDRTDRVPVTMFQGLMNTFQCVSLYSKMSMILWNFGVFNGILSSPWTISVIEHFHLLRKWFSCRVSMKNLPPSCIYLVRLTPAVCKSRFRDPAISSWTSCENTQHAGSSCIPSSLCSGKIKQRVPEVTTTVDLNALAEFVSNCAAGHFSRLCGLTRASPRASGWPADQWRLCILGRGGVPRPARCQSLARRSRRKPGQPPKEKHDQGQQTVLNTRGGRQNKHDRDNVRRLWQEGWIGLGLNPQRPPRKLTG